MDEITKKRFVDYWRTREVTVTEVKRPPKIVEEYGARCFICEATRECPNLITLHHTKGYTASKWVCQQCCLEAGWVW